MPPLPHHPWDLSPAAARQLQQRLATHVIRHDDFPPPQRVAGVDVGFEDGGRTTRAAVAVLSFPELQLIEGVIARRPTSFPYIPGLLSFREIPAVLQAFDRLTHRPDLLLCDGQGIAHPRRLGIASHLGLLLDLPSIGVAKKRLLGSHAALPETKGSWVELRDGEEIIGVVLRSRTGVKPLYISGGHRVGTDSARRLTLACITRYRLPETTRWAHRLASGPLPPTAGSVLTPAALQP